jgi:hypothetical protein
MKIKLTIAVVTLILLFTSSFSWAEDIRPFSLITVTPKSSDNQNVKYSVTFTNTAKKIHLEVPAIYSTDGINANTPSLDKNFDKVSFTVKLKRISTTGIASYTTIGKYRYISSTTLEKEYTKIANDGSELLDSAVLGSNSTDWACTKDNKTGLIWEVKTSDGGLRDMNNTYTFYNPNSNESSLKFPNGTDYPSNIQHPEYCNSSDCDTNAFNDAVNRKGLCGSNNWRIPSEEELTNLVYCSDGFYNKVDDSITGYICKYYKDVQLPSINTFYFPNTKDYNDFWSSSQTAYQGMWVVSFYGGHRGFEQLYKNNSVRLVSDKSSNVIPMCSSGKKLDPATNACVSIVPKPDVTSYTSQPYNLTLNTFTTFTFTGVDLVSGMQFILDGCNGVTELANGSATQRQFSCTPISLGEKKGILKTSDGITVSTISETIKESTPVTPTCPSGQILNPATNTCVTPAPVIPTCYNGQVLNQAQTACVTPTPVIPTCYNGQVLNQAKTACVTPAPVIPTCYNGQVLNQAKTACVTPTPVIPTCYDGQVINPIGTGCMNRPTSYKLFSIIPENTISVTGERSSDKPYATLCIPERGVNTQYGKFIRNYTNEADCADDGASWLLQQGIKPKKITSCPYGYVLNNAQTQCIYAPPTCSTGKVLNPDKTDCVNPNGGNTNGGNTNGGNTNGGKTGYLCPTTKKPFDPNWIQSHGSYWAAANAHDQGAYDLEKKYCATAKQLCEVVTKSINCPG